VTQQAQALEIETAPAPDAAVLWLHGLGADGHDFEPLVPQLRLPPQLRVRFVFPHAPVRPVTLNMGMRMRAWYDILQLGGGREDEAGIRESQALLEALIARERRRGVVAQRIVLAGFSQGGAVALHTGLRHAERLAGILALSTYLPLAGSLAPEHSAVNLGVPLFMAHGRFDDIIPIERARQSRVALEGLGCKVEWREYAMPHAVCGEEIADIAAWLRAVL
jgi:phospholipase/carboxylesterase